MVAVPAEDLLAVVAGQPLEATVHVRQRDAVANGAADRDADRRLIDGACEQVAVDVGVGALGERRVVAGRAGGGDAVDDVADARRDPGRGVGIGTDGQVVGDAGGDGVARETLQAVGGEQDDG